MQRLTPVSSRPDTPFGPAVLLTMTEDNSGTQDYSSSAPEELADWPVDDLDDWPFDDPSVDVARLRESLREADADVAAGRTFGEDEIRARYGLPPK